MRIPIISFTAAGALALAGCAYGYGDYGYGGGYGYGGYGSYGYSPYGYSPYGYYGGSSYGLGSYYGWYDDFYYPGTGIYVYDVHRRRHSWNDRQRSYWTQRPDNVVRTSNVSTSSVRTTKPALRENWSGFSRRPMMRSRTRP
jgi:hypothetical protein